MALVNDAEIDRLLKVRKIVQNCRARPIEQKGSTRVNYDLAGADGERFQLFLRQNLRIPEAFSCSLLYHHPAGEKVTLVRYNGSDHEHSNPLDSGKPLPLACHIHLATERYIDAGRKAEHYAETTDRYSELNGAFACLLNDCNVQGFDDNPSIFQIPLL